jgi:hypothetical protein
MPTCQLVTNGNMSIICMYELGMVLQLQVINGFHLLLVCDDFL